MSGVLGETAQNSSAPGTVTSFYRKQNQPQKHPLCFLFRIDLYCLAAPTDRTSVHHLRFFQAETRRTGLSTSPTAGSGDTHTAHGSRAAGMCLARCAAPCTACGPSRQGAVSPQHAAGRPLVPASLLQSRRCQKLKCFFFSFPHTNPVSDKDRAPSS